jgi:hypothetical protein
MYDIIHPHCIECKKTSEIPVPGKYNYPGMVGARYCTNCKKDGMIEKYPDKRYQSK